MQRSSLQRVALALVWATIMLVGTPPLSAQCEDKLIASPPVAGDQFGHSVSISGRWALVGSPYDDDKGNDSGSVSVYRIDMAMLIPVISELQKLYASDAAVDDNFGFTVSIKGDVAIVGAPNSDCPAGVDCGSAYIFRLNDNGTPGLSDDFWVEEKRLTAQLPGGADDTEPGAEFGHSVSVDGDVIIVGAQLDDCLAGANCGSGYVYRFNGTTMTWDPEQKLTASDAAPNDEFGHAVSVSSGLVVVGAHLSDCTVGPDCGSGYVFRFNGSIWDEEQKLTAQLSSGVDDTAPEDKFGQSVSVFSGSVNGDMVIVGAHLDDCSPPAPSGDDCGSAYVYRFNRTTMTWVPEQKLTAPDLAPGDEFGYAVFIISDPTFGDEAFVGARLGDKIFLGPSPPPAGSGHRGGLRIQLCQRELGRGRESQRCRL